MTLNNYNYHVEPLNMTGVLFSKVCAWDYFHCLFLIIESVFLTLCLHITTVQRFSWRLLIAYVIIVIKILSYLGMDSLDVDHFFIFASTSLASPYYGLSPRAVYDFATSGALTFPHSQLLKFSKSMYLRIAWLQIWTVKHLQICILILGFGFNFKSYYSSEWH